jgi:hypothetical protein
MLLNEPWSTRSLAEAEEHANRILSSDDRLGRHFAGTSNVGDT